MLKRRRKILQFNAKPFWSLEAKISPIVVLVSPRLGISWLPSFAWRRFPSADWQLTKRQLLPFCQLFFCAKNATLKNTYYFHQTQGSTAILVGSWTLYWKIGTHWTWLDIKVSDYSYISRTSSWQAFCHLCMHIIYHTLSHSDSLWKVWICWLANSNQSILTQMSAAGSIHQFFFSLPSRSSSFSNLFLIFPGFALYNSVKRSY